MVVEPTEVKRWFFWRPQWFYSWPVKVIRGEDEYGWRTLGVVTWAGSIFYRTGMCHDAECVEARESYWADRDT